MFYTVQIREKYYNAQPVGNNLRQACRALCELYPQVMRVSVVVLRDGNSGKRYSVAEAMTILGDA